MLCCCALLVLPSLPLLPSRQLAHAQAQQQVGGELIIGGAQEPDSLNPLITQTVAGQAMDSAVFDSLLRLDDHNVLQPDLALSWQHSADGLTWTFHLRQNVRWPDTRQLFTSTDVYYTYLVIRNPQNNVASTQGWNEVDSMRTPDRWTVVLHLRRLLAPWLLTIGTTAILPKHYLFPRHDFTTGSFNRLPFGTGPYRVTAWVVGDHVTLTANPLYWGGAPHIGALIYRFFPNDAQVLAALRDRRVQMGQINAQQMRIAARFSGTALVRSPGMTWYHMDLKQVGFLRDQAVRQALDFATPKDALVHDILNGYGVTAQADVSPAFTMYYNPNVQVHHFNLLRAAELLAAAGFHAGTDGVLQRNGQPLSLTLWSIAGDYFGAQINARVQREWAKIGVQTVLRTDRADHIFGPLGPQFSHDPTGLTYGWTNTPDPDDRFYWNSAFIPTSPTAAGGNDVAYFFRFSFQSQIDSLTDAGVLQTDPVKRRAIYSQVQALLADQTPVIFLYWQDTLMVIPKALQGYRPSPFMPLFWNVAQWR